MCHIFYYVRGDSRPKVIMPSTQSSWIASYSIIAQLNVLRKLGWARVARVTHVCWQLTRRRDPKIKYRRHDPKGDQSITAAAYSQVRYWSFEVPSIEPPFEQEPNLTRDTYFSTLQPPVSGKHPVSAFHNHIPLFTHSGGKCVFC